MRERQRVRGRQRETEQREKAGDCLKFKSLKQSEGVTKDDKMNKYQAKKLSSRGIFDDSGQVESRGVLCHFPAQNFAECNPQRVDVGGECMRLALGQRGVSVEGGDCSKCDREGRRVCLLAGFKVAKYATTL